MRKGSSVKYIGGQDRTSKKHCPLNSNKIYRVKELCEAKFKKEWRKAVKLSDFEEIAFDRDMFVEVTTKIDLSEIYNKTNYSILKNLN